MAEKWIITGAAGFLGRTVAAALLREGRAVTGLILPREEPPALGPLFRAVRGDVLDEKSLDALFDEVGRDDRVNFVHAAGLIAVGGPNPALHRVNVEGTRNVLALAERRRVRRLVYVSSTHALPELPRGQTQREVNRFFPDALADDYSKSKARASQLVLDAAARGLNAVIVHPSGMLGPGDRKGMASIFIQEFLRGRLPLAIGGGYDFVDVRDVADGIIRAGAGDAPGPCYLLTNRAYTVRWVMDEIARFAGKRPTLGTLPLPLVRALTPLIIPALRLVDSPLKLSGAMLTILGSNALFSNEKASRELGYRPRPMEETLRDAVKELLPPAV